MRRGIQLISTLSLTLAACHGGGGGSSSNAPKELSYGTPDAVYVTKVPIEENVPTVKGEVSSWSITPTPPTGLFLDPKTGVLSGIPEVEMERTAFTVFAKGPGGQTKTTLHLSILLPARFAYAPSGDDTIGIYTVDPWSGDLRFHGLHHHSAPHSGPEQMAVHPSGRFVYVPNAGEVQSDSTITAYEVDGDQGGLSLIGHVPIGEGPHRVLLHPDGTRVYATSFMDHLIHTYQVDEGSGALTLLDTIQTNTGPERLAIDPSGRFVYVVHRPSADIRAFSVDPVTKTLEYGAGGFNYYKFIPSDVQVSHDGKQAYFTFEETDNLISYRIDQTDGALTIGDGASTSGRPRALLLHPDKELAYVACPDTATIDVFALDSSADGVDPVMTVSAGSSPTELVFDESGRQLYALNVDSNDVSVFAVDLETGTLEAEEPVRTRAAATHLAVLRGDRPALLQGEFAYAVNAESDDLSAFHIHPLTGALIPGGANAATGDDPGWVVVDPIGRFLWVANRGDGTLSQFSIVPATGEVTESVPPYELGATPGGLAVCPSGAYLFASLNDSNEVVAFSVHPATGALTETDRAPSAAGPAEVAVDPTGQFVYVSILGTSANSISTYAVLDGTFQAPPLEAAAPGGPGRVRFAPDGARAYVPLESSRLLVPYLIDSQTGGLSVLAEGAEGTLSSPAAVALHPGGGLAFAALPGEPQEAGQIGRFAVDTASGALSYLGEKVEGLAPAALAVGPSGRFLYVANGGGDDVSVFAIDEQEGELTLVGYAAAGLSPSDLVVTAKVE